MEKQIKETDNKFIGQVDQEFQAKRQKFRPAVYGSYHNHVAIREMFLNSTIYVHKVSLDQV